MIKTGFMLCAGFGTRFKPQTHFLPKPAMPFFNLPIALYPAGLLKLLGVNQIHYNSHHLPEELNQALSKPLGNKALFESTILDSAGGILNASKHLKEDENFWVVNGDSYIATQDFDAIKEIAKNHIKENRLATFFCIPKESEEKSGLEPDSNGNLLRISKDPKAQHFVGLYILNKRIFKYIKNKPSHIFKDVILPLIKEENIKVANLGTSTRWLETGSEEHFINAHISETKHIFNKTDKSFIMEVHKMWNKDYQTDLYNFLNTKVWGGAVHGHAQSKFNCVPKNFKGNVKLLKNCVVATESELPPIILENKVLVDASQWN